MNKPAEKLTGLAAAGVAIPAAFAGNWELFATSVVLGVLPALVTGWVDVGGLNGLRELFWRGRRR